MQRAPILLLHYGELWLKGCNRPFFLRRLREAIERNLEGLPVRYERHAERRMIVTAENEPAAREALERLRKTPGVQNIGLGYATRPELEAIVELGSEVMAGRDFRTFRVRARRSSKKLPFRSTEVERALGTRILREASARGRDVSVDLNHAEATCWVEATTEQAFVYAEKITACGGLPTSTAGRLVCLLSGGLDSPVAAYKILKRGVRLTFVHFWGPPARPGEESAPIAREIVKLLTPYQGRSRLYLVPFDGIQREVVASAPEAFRLLIYRRLMLRIAERIGWRHDCLGTVTGDSISQVASQTLQNMEAVQAVARKPVYRPLAGDDKQEIIRIARSIGAFEISSEPFTDCCPMYLPKSPRIFSSVRELDEAEAGLDLSRLVFEGVDRARREVYQYRGGEVRLESVKENESHREKLEEPVAG